MAGIDWNAWHHDGHKLHVGVSLYGTARQGQLDGTVECPEGSICHQHFASNQPEYRCLIEGEIEAMSFWDFIEQLEAPADLPADWSSEFPIEIEWQDRRDDGIYWRPVVA